MSKFIEFVGVVLFLLCCAAGLPVWLACCLMSGDNPGQALFVAAGYVLLWYGSACAAFGKADVDAMLSQVWKEARAAQAERERGE